MDVEFNQTLKTRTSCMTAQRCRGERVWIWRPDVIENPGNTFHTASSLKGSLLCLLKGRGGYRVSPFRVSRIILALKTMTSPWLSMHFSAGDSRSTCGTRLVSMWPWMGARESQRARKRSRKSLVKDGLPGGRRCRDPQEGNISFSTLIASPPPLSPPHTIKMIFTWHCWKAALMQSTHACNSRRRERWASTGNSFTAFLLTKASEWEQGTKECDVYGLRVIWGPVRAAYAQPITTVLWVCWFQHKTASLFLLIIIII